MKSKNFPKQRGAAYTKLLLRFLAQEGYTSSAMLQLLFDLKSNKSISDKINCWLKKGIVEPVAFKNPFGGKPPKLLRLTAHGQALARGLGLEPRYEVKPTLTTYQHTIFLQKTKIALMRRGFFGFQSEKQIEDALKKFGHYPDLFCCDINAQRVIIEAEITLKAKSRYQQLIADFLAAIEAKHLDQIIYVLPDESTKSSLINTMRSACGKSFERKGLKKVIDIEKVKNHFRFFTLAEIEEEKGECIHFQELYSSENKIIDLCQLHFGSEIECKKNIIIESLSDKKIIQADFDKTKFAGEVLKKVNAASGKIYNKKELSVYEFTTDANSIDSAANFRNFSGKAANDYEKELLLKVMS